MTALGGGKSVYLLNRRLQSKNSDGEKKGQRLSCQVPYLGKKRKEDEEKRAKNKGIQQCSLCMIQVFMSLC